MATQPAPTPLPQTRPPRHLLGAICTRRVGRISGKCLRGLSHEGARDLSERSQAVLVGSPIRPRMGYSRGRGRYRDVRDFLRSVCAYGYWRGRYPAPPKAAYPPITRRGGGGWVRPALISRSLRRRPAALMRRASGPVELRATVRLRLGGYLPRDVQAVRKNTPPLSQPHPRGGARNRPKLGLYKANELKKRPI